MKSNSPLTQVNLLIKNERTRQGLTLEQLGQRMGVGRAAVWKIENSQTDLRVSTIARALQALGMDPKIELNAITNPRT